MTDLEPRLHHLRQTPVPAGPDPAEVRARAGRRKARRHRRIALGTIPVVALLLVGVATALSGNDGPESVVTGTDPTTTDAAPGPTTTRPMTTMGNVDGVTLDVAPTTGLRDGQLVTVEIDGLDAFSYPIIILCAGDVSEETAASDCDLTPLERSEASDPDATASSSQQVAVRRIIRLPREATPEDDQGGDFDCATEPVGCALVVGNNSLPATGMGVPVSFSDDPLPSPSITADPARGLDDRQEVTVEATGLRPNSTFLITQCRQDRAGACDEISWPSAKTDGTGTLRTTYPVHTAIYGWKGRVDCTAEPCVIEVRTEGGEPQGEVPITFASDAVALVPQLAISPAGPYEDRQQVTVTGTGFPPGFDVSSALGQCPADVDSAVQNLCGYGALRNGAIIVDEQGRFTTTIELFAEPCRTEAGCVLGWVLNHGPTIAKVPLPFR